jgi:peroxiredoxin
MNLRLRCAAFAVATLLPLTALAQSAPVGEPAPAFTLTDQAGQTHTLESYRGKVVVLEWTNPECPYVVRHYNADTMENGATAWGDDVVWLAVDSSNFVTPESSAAFAAAEGFSYPTLQDPSGEVGRAYGARTTPHMFVIDAEGVVRYNGAIDDDPRGRNESPTNYVNAAVTALLAGEAPEVAQTEPYGCSVKYPGS